MTDNHNEGDHKQPAPEKQAERVVRISEQKAGAEAGEDLKAGSLNHATKAKRQEQFKSGQSGATGQGDQHGRFRSAKEIFGDAAHTPLTKEAEANRNAEFKSKHGDPNELQGKKVEKQEQREQSKAPEQLNKEHPESTKPAPPNFQRATEAAGKAVQSLYNAGSGALSETGKFLKGMGDGEVEYVKELGDSLNVAGDYYGQALAGKGNLGADIKEFSGAIGQTLGTAGDYYFNQVPKGQANLGNDIGQAGKAAADHWNSLDSEQKGHFVGKEIVPLAVPGAVGIVAKEVQSANLVGKAGEAITALTSAEKIAQMEQKINQLQGHVQKFSEVLGKPMQPAYATVNDGPGRPMMPLETAKPDDGIFMMKGDKGLPQGVKPSERVVLSNTATEEGHLIPRIDVPKEVYKAAESRGFTKEQVQEKLQNIAKAVKDVYSQIGDYDPKIHGSEKAYGNRFHEMLRQDLNKLHDKTINTEASYLKEKPSEWGKLGTSRVDIALGDKNEPFASVCLKTLKALPSAQQERGWARNLTKLSDGSIPPRLFLKIQKSLDK